MSLSPPTSSLVDVAIITYNHEAFIRQALDGVLAQQTSFPVRMVIGEDCSTDGTRAILQEYQQRYPDRIQLLLPAHNIGVMANLVNVINACQAPYVALLEGDDCWTDVHKLQQQVDFLEGHQDFSLCFHDAELFWDGHEQPAYPLSQLKKQLQNGEAEFTHADIVRDGWFIPTASIVFRRSAAKNLPDWLLNVFSGDYSLHLLISAAGKVKYLPAVMSGYRQHPGGISQQKYNPGLLTRKIYENESYRRHFDRQHAPQFTRNISNLYLEQADYQRKNGAYAAGWRSWWHALQTDPQQTLRVFVRKLRS